MNKNSSSSRRVLGIFTLTMINTAAILSLRNFTMTAGVGWTSLFFYVLAGLGFFIPCGLVSAELATAWPERGVYTWVKKAFGARWGFVAIWLQWIENVIYYPAILSFTAATSAYLFSPALSNNKWYILSIILVTFWTFTFVNALGMKVSGLTSTIGVIVGSIIPGLFIIGLSAFWLLLQKESHLSFSWGTLVPDMSQFHNLSFLAGVILALAGMEMSAVHAKEVKNPQKNYPKAIFTSTVVILMLYVLGSLAIAVVVPKEEINLVAGTMQAFASFFDAFGIKWMMSLLAIVIVVGSIATVSTWIIGPSKGLLQTADEGHLPPIFHKTNRFGMPISILIIQAIIVSLLCSAYIFMPTISSSYWALTDLSAIVYLIMYILMFMAGIRLRYSHPNTPRAYRIPGGKTWGMWIVATIGISVSLLTIALSPFPPFEMEKGATLSFQLFILVGTLILFGTPLILYACQKEHWKTDIFSK